MDSKTGGQVALGCGSLLLLLSCAFSGFFLFHVVADPGGAISDDEALPGVVGGVFCFLVSVALAGAGAFLAFRSTATESGAASAVGGGSGPSMASGQLPTLGVGCGALMALSLACLATGGVPYFSSEISRWESMRDEDLRTGADPIIVMIDDGAIAENETNRNLSAGCAACSGFIGLLGIGGAAALYFRGKRAA